MEEIPPPKKNKHFEKLVRMLFLHQALYSILMSNMVKIVFYDAKWFYYHFSRFCFSTFNFFFFFIITLNFLLDLAHQLWDLKIQKKKRKDLRHQCEWNNYITLLRVFLNSFRISKIFKLFCVNSCIFIEHHKLTFWSMIEYHFE